MGDLRVDIAQTVADLAVLPAVAERLFPYVGHDAVQVHLCAGAFVVGPLVVRAHFADTTEELVDEHVQRPQAATLMCIFVFVFCDHVIKQV